MSTLRRPGTHFYKVTVKDPFGNAVTTPSVSISIN